MKNDFNELHSLYHHGIIGQHWGERRFQNKDGTLTAEGKERLKQKRGELEATAGVFKAAKEVTDSARQIPIETGKVERGVYPYLSDKELQDRINRMSLEQRYSDLKGDTKYVKSGGEKAKELLQTVGAVAGIGVTLATLAKLFYDIKYPIKQKTALK